MPIPHSAAAAPAKAEPPAPALALPPYRPTTLRHLLLIVLLTLATVLGIALAMLQPHKQLMAAKASRDKAAALAACPPAAVSAAPGCPGSRMEVWVLPATP